MLFDFHNPSHLSGLLFVADRMPVSLIDLDSAKSFRFEPVPFTVEISNFDIRGSKKLTAKFMRGQSSNLSGRSSVAHFPAIMVSKFFALPRPSGSAARSFISSVQSAVWRWLSAMISAHGCNCVAGDVTQSRKILIRRFSSSCFQPSSKPFSIHTLCAALSHRSIEQGYYV
jgi:hypothetical protein